LILQTKDNRLLRIENKIVDRKSICHWV